MLCTDTAYVKTEKRLSVKPLIDLCTGARGVDWSLQEINKVIALSGLTVLIIAFTPNFVLKSRGLVWNAMVLLWTHAMYSMYKFYQFSIKAYLKEKMKIKQVSIIFAVLGQIVLSAGYFGYISWTNLMYGSIILGTAHFWTYEVDFKYVLQVRPFAYLPFIMAPAVIAYHLIYG